MKMEEYQRAAVRTARDQGGEMPPLWYLALGLTGEAGEVAEDVKKIARHGREFDADRIADEVGDCLWYIAAIAEAIGVPLDEIAQRNVKKLRKRYPRGFEAGGGNR